MKDDTFQNLANRLGLDRSTVSRAVRHCPGVDSRTRSLVLEEARRTGVRAAAGPCSIYCILPDIPTYFWQTYYSELKESLNKANIPARFSSYSRIYDRETVLLYLDDVIQSGARVLILTIGLSETIRDKLLEMQRSGLYVILLSEYGELPNSAYVGADPYQDGELIGRWFCRHYPGETPLILDNVSGNDNVAQRIRGFLHSLEQFRPAVAKDAPVVKLTEGFFRNSKTLPAQYAALFNQVKKDYSCVYVPFGSICLPLSVLKTRKLTKVRLLFGHDCFTKAGADTLYPGFTASCNQNIGRQVSTAIGLAVSYLNEPVMPAQQSFHFIPSKVLCVSEEPAG